ncbi:DUF6933 domain-containing protein [Desulfotalea psychrophila]|uniref:DUF6933 domain-containing protein n=1 Tax=Desulfotalea psychrophila (strain LSv54 / DSM 12343) TaxID=177439 RepID=Q6ARA6_DESPS|nr:hypothetical protein [Desulfotalea psychrophila]CAG35118.1 unknown protein [Desulfotalea psychrophila LSv54]
MLIFNCTRTACNFFTVSQGGVKVSPVEPAPHTNLADDDLKNSDGTKPALMQWLIHLIRVQGKNIILAMEIKSHYCMIFAGLKKGDATTFIQLFYERLFNNMQWYGESIGFMDETSFQPMATNFIKAHDEFRFFARDDAKIQKSIDNVAKDIRLWASKHDSSGNAAEQAAEFNQRVNSIPHKAGSQQGAIPSEVMFIYWIGHFCNAQEKEIKMARQRFEVLKKRELEQLGLLLRSKKNDS